MNKSVIEKFAFIFLSTPIWLTLLALIFAVNFEKIKILNGTVEDYEVGLFLISIYFALFIFGALPIFISKSNIALKIFLFLIYTVCGALAAFLIAYFGVIFIECSTPGGCSWK